MRGLKVKSFKEGNEELYSIYISCFQKFMSLLREKLFLKNKQAYTPALIIPAKSKKVEPINF